MKPKRMAVLLLLVAGLLGVSVIDAAAKGAADWVEFQMPGTYRNFRLEMDEVPAALTMGQLEDFLAPIQGPDNVGPGFLITRGWFDDKGEARPWDQVMFFANLDGELGYVYYFGIVNGSSEYDGRWFQITQEGQAALAAALDAEGVHIAGLNPGRYYTFGDGPSLMSVEPAEEDSAAQVAELPAVLGGLALAGLGLWWAYRPKRD